MLNARFLDAPQADEGQRRRWAEFWSAPRALIAWLSFDGAREPKASLWEIEPETFLTMWRGEERLASERRGGVCGARGARSEWRSDRALASGEGARVAAELRRCFQSALERQLARIAPGARVAAPTGSALTEALSGAWVFGVAPLAEGFKGSLEGVETLSAIAQPRGEARLGWEPGASAAALRAWERWELEQSSAPARQAIGQRARKA